MEIRDNLHPLVSEVVSTRTEKSGVVPAIRLTSRLQQLLASLREPPVLAVAQTFWYQAKALELASELFFVPADGRNYSASDSSEFRRSGWRKWWRCCAGGWPNRQPWRRSAGPWGAARAI
jgi:hypothetical protein